MILIPDHLLELITTAAEITFPDECCGLLVGHSMENDDPMMNRLVVNRVEASPNLTQGAREESFEVDPKLQFDLMRELSGGPDRIVGHYHSHPGGSPVPSRRDLDMAREPELVWIITSVVDGLAAHTLGWRLNKAGNGFIKVTVSKATDK